jgi:hypothetical protein
VDYGVERSEKYGHSRFGHTYQQGEVSFYISDMLLISSLTYLICFMANSMPGVSASMTT